MSNSFWPNGLQNARLPCPSQAPGACSHSWQSSQWCHPTISSSVVPFSSCLQSFVASGSFPMSQFFTSGGQTIGVSASASVLQMNIQDWFPFFILFYFFKFTILYWFCHISKWFPLGLTALISLQSKGLSRVFSNTIKGINVLALSFLYGLTLTSIHD